MLLIAVRVFALLTLLFVPAFIVLLLVALFGGTTFLFELVGLPALLLNAIVVLTRPQRDRVWRAVHRIAATDARR